MSIVLELPDDIGRRLIEHEPAAEADLRRELAIALYKEGKLPCGHAAEVAGMDSLRFNALLIERKVTMPWTQEDVENEFRHATRHL